MAYQIRYLPHLVSREPDAISPAVVLFSKGQILAGLKHEGDGRRKGELAIEIVWSALMTSRGSAGAAMCVRSCSGVVTMVAL